MSISNSDMIWSQARGSRGGVPGHPSLRGFLARSPLSHRFHRAAGIVLRRLVAAMAVAAAAVAAVVAAPAAEWAAAATTLAHGCDGH
mmetsp:Transcript_54461/g.137529  ORF Transcript_54461/g.137529 Transcript_54461/m.137529 type:complete len:87 (-) Transcript_54461:1456-1716(-)